MNKKMMKQSHAWKLVEDFVLFPIYYFDNKCMKIVYFFVYLIHSWSDRRDSTRRY